LTRARRQIFLALFTALAVALHTMEAFLPTPVPWFRLGLANILSLVALFSYGGRAAWTVNLARIGIGSLILGRLFGPGFWLALAGAALATAAMIAAYRLAGRWLGPIGISVLGAVGHTLGQMTLAWLLLIRHDGLWQLLPVFLLMAAITGVLTGWAAVVLLEQLSTHKAFQHIGRQDG
jgi:heptaprenyl diphosphate synthase